MGPLVLLSMVSQHRHQPQPSQCQPRSLSRSQSWSAWCTTPPSGTRSTRWRLCRNARLTTRSNASLRARGCARTLPGKSAELSKTRCATLCTRRTVYEPYTETECVTLYKENCEYHWVVQGNTKV